MKSNKHHTARLFIGLFSLHTFSCCHSIKEKNYQAILNTQLANHKGITNINNNDIVSNRLMEKSSNLKPWVYTNIAFQEEGNRILNAIKGGAKKIIDSALERELEREIQQYAGKVLTEPIKSYLKANHYSEKALKYLLRLGLSIHARDENNNTLLILAVDISKSIYGINFLLELKCKNKNNYKYEVDVNEQNNAGITALFLAVDRVIQKKAHPRLIALLLERGANPLIKTRQQNSALSYVKYQAKDTSDPRIKKLLEDLKIIVQFQRANGNVT